jgi:hypothetical protein
VTADWGCPQILFLIGIVIVLLLRSPCKISEPYLKKRGVVILLTKIEVLFHLENKFADVFQKEIAEPVEQVL